jgi:aminoglycoside phosphotransferase (APT) family kinase protein
MKKIDFNPNREKSRCEAYLSQALSATTHLFNAIPLVKSTRTAPWKVDVEVEGNQRSFVLRLGNGDILHEYHALSAMTELRFPVPCPYGLDQDGIALGQPCFLMDYLEGENLLQPMFAGEKWAEDLYLETVCKMQAISLEQLTHAGLKLMGGTSPQDVMDYSNEYFCQNPNSLAQTVYSRLQETMPSFPGLHFSNGDLWLENFIVKDKQLVGVVDFEQAGYSDPVYEFLLSFFVEPQLRNRGIEERYCKWMGLDPSNLHWYHGLEYYETWHWVLKRGKPFLHYTDEILKEKLLQWLDLTD